MTQPNFTFENGIYTKSNQKKPFWILTILSIILIILGIWLYFSSNEPYPALFFPTILGVLILAGATNKLVIDTKSKQITQSFLFGIISFKKKGKLYNQYQLIDNYVNGVNIGVQIYLISKENLSKKVFMIGPFKDEENIEKHTNIAIEIIDKLQCK